MDYLILMTKEDKAFLDRMAKELEAYGKAWNFPKK